MQKDQIQGTPKPYKAGISPSGQALRPQISSWIIYLNLEWACGGRRKRAAKGSRFSSRLVGKRENEERGAFFVTNALLGNCYRFGHHGPETPIVDLQVSKSGSGSA